MDAIYSATMLRDRPREVKEAARHNLVRITENGNGAFVFCSEEIYREKIAEAAEQAAYETRVSMAIERGRADVAAGRVFDGSLDDLFDEAERRAIAHG